MRTLLITRRLKKKIPGKRVGVNVKNLWKQLKQGKSRLYRHKDDVRQFQEKTPGIECSVFEEKIVSTTLLCWI